ncbi:DHH family phosphoesterase [Streptococcus caprae]|uniref:Bifunctional oligoribonuclease/PAP phosphatase NrnA n=1 Tax=Streptococcus caprae TaxID=1640501 RepID=A0ABV8CWC9_9STRE
MTIFNQILEQIKAYDTIIIHRHQNPDTDALGSQLGLREILRTNFPDKSIYAVGFDEPSLSWMAKMDQVEDAAYTDALVIVTDTANTPRIDDSRYTSGNYLIKIDHHPDEDPYGDLLHVDTTASSASEIITDFARGTCLNLSTEAARLLYAGIVGDTGRFLYSATTSKTFQMAAYLREFDFDFAGLGRQLDSFPYKIAKLQGYVFDNLEVSPEGAARIVLTQEILKTYEVTEAESSAIVSAPGKIDSVQSWAIFVEKPDGTYRVRLRSKIQPISPIAKRHDGGGHPLASGANSFSLQENEEIFQELRDNLAE